MNFVPRLSKFANGLAKPLREFRQFLRTEHHQQDDENYQAGHWGQHGELGSQWDVHGFVGFDG